MIFISLIPGKRVATVGSPELVVPAGRAKRLIVEPNDETRLTCLIFPPQLAARPPFQVPVPTTLKISVANLDLLVRGIDPDPSIIHQAKIVRKKLDSYCSVTSL